MSLCAALHLQDNFSGAVIFLFSVISNLLFKNQFPTSKLSRLGGEVARGQTDEKKKASVDSSRYSDVKEACGKKNSGRKNRTYLETERERDAAKSL